MIMASSKLLDQIARFNAANCDGNTGGASLAAAWAVVMCLAIIALLVVSGCAAPFGYDPDPFKGFWAMLIL
jgi:hypothetical protein